MTEYIYGAVQPPREEDKLQSDIDAALERARAVMVAQTRGMGRKEAGAVLPALAHAQWRSSAGELRLKPASAALIAAGEPPLSHSRVAASAGIEGAADGPRGAAGVPSLGRAPGYELVLDDPASAASALLARAADASTANAEAAFVAELSEQERNALLAAIEAVEGGSGGGAMATDTGERKRRRRPRGREQHRHRRHQRRRREREPSTGSKESDDGPTGDDGVGGGEHDDGGRPR